MLQSFSNDYIDLTDADEFAYSAIVRKLRQKTSEENVFLFLQLFKKEFDKAVKKKLQKPERIALQESLVIFNKSHKIKLDKELIKDAATSELGAAEQVGKYLSNIVKFTVSKAPRDKQQSYINKIKQKFQGLNESQLANKNMPDSATIGQAITFVKTVLFNHDSGYVRDVLNHLIKNL